jgi:hypothetical protein
VSRMRGGRTARGVISQPPHLGLSRESERADRRAFGRVVKRAPRLVASFEVSTSLLHLVFGRDAAAAEGPRITLAPGDSNGVYDNFGCCSRSLAACCESEPGLPHPLSVIFGAESRFDRLRALDSRGNVQRRVRHASEFASRVPLRAAQSIRQSSTVDGYNICGSQLAGIRGSCKRDCRAIALPRHSMNTLELRLLRAELRLRARLAELSGGCVVAKRQTQMGTPGVMS